MPRIHTNGACTQRLGGTSKLRQDQNLGVLITLAAFGVALGDNLLHQQLHGRVQMYSDINRLIYILIYIYIQIGDMCAYRQNMIKTHLFWCVCVGHVSLVSPDFVQVKSCQICI